MPEPIDSDEFKEIEIPSVPSLRAKEESDQLENRYYETPPNSVSLNLGKYCQVRWHADSSAPLFCFVSIAALLLFGVLIGVVSACNSAMTWPGEVFKFLGQAVLTLVGAVVGASARSTSSTRPRKPNSRS